MSVDPRKVSAVRDWPNPESIVDVRRFVGPCNFYRWFVAGYADIAAPLTRLCGLHAPWSWGPDQQRSFERVPDRRPSLRTFDSGRRSILTTDVSEEAISAILSQPDDTGLHHPVAYESHKVTTAEQAYPPHVLDVL